MLCPSLPIGGHVPPPSRSKISGDYHQYAPLNPISVDDAIGDLVRLVVYLSLSRSHSLFFFWNISHPLNGLLSPNSVAFSILARLSRINPHQVIPKSSFRKHNRRSLETPIPQFNAVLLQGNKGTIFSNPGFPEGVPYMSGPQNRYQKWLRQGMVDEETDTESEVQDHFTGRFSAFLVEAYVGFPLSALWGSRHMLDIGLSRYHCGPTLTTKVCMHFSFNSVFNTKIFYTQVLPTELQPTYAMPGRKQWKHCK